MDTTRLLRFGELVFPGFAVGFIAGWALVSMLALGVPLSLLSGGYSLLVVHRKVRIGAFAPAALFWLVGFPLARLAHEVLTHLILAGRPQLPPDLLGFLAYQGILSAGFAIGYLWLHERIAPRWWRKVAPHNPEAAGIYAVYAEYAKQVYEQRQARRQNRARAATRQR